MVDGALKEIDEIELWSAKKSFRDEMLTQLDVKMKNAYIGFKAFMNTLKKEMRSGLLTPVMFVGQSGSGKSISALTTALLYSRHKFSFENIVFTAGDFLERVTHCKAGETIIFDDAGVEYNARQWMNQQNKLLSAAIQVMRFKKFLPIWTCPSIHMLDINARVITKYIWNVKRTVFENRKPVYSIADLYYNIDGMLYIAETKILDEAYPMKNVRIPSPPREVLEIYQKIAKYQKQDALEKAYIGVKILEEREKEKMRKKASKINKSPSIPIVNEGELEVEG